MGYTRRANLQAALRRPEVRAEIVLGLLGALGLLHSSELLWETYDVESTWVYAWIVAVVGAALMSGRARGAASLRVRDGELFYVAPLHGMEFRWSAEHGQADMRNAALPVLFTTAGAIVVHEFAWQPFERISVLLFGVAVLVLSALTLGWASGRAAAAFSLLAAIDKTREG